MKLPEWITGLKRRAVGQAEGQDVLGMGMHHRHHIGARFENAAMDEAFEIGRALFLP